MFGERLGFLALVGLILGYAAIVSLGFPDRARIFPLTVAAAGLVLVVVEAARMFAARRRGAGQEQTGGSALAQLRVGAPYLARIVGFYALIWLAGFLIACVAFVALFLTTVARMAVWRALLVALSIALVLLMLQAAFDVRWPPGVLAHGQVCPDRRLLVRGKFPVQIVPELTHPRDAVHAGEPLDRLPEAWLLPRSVPRGFRWRRTVVSRSTTLVSDGCGIRGRGRGGGYLAHGQGDHRAV